MNLGRSAWSPRLAMYRRGRTLRQQNYGVSPDKKRASVDQTDQFPGGYSEVGQKRHSVECASLIDLGAEVSDVSESEGSPG
jgi:hypothetical protein